MEVKVATFADHAKAARDLQPSTYGNRREKLSRVGAIGARGSRASAFDRFLARADTRRTDYAFGRVRWTLTFRTVAHTSGEQSSHTAD